MAEIAKWPKDALLTQMEERSIPGGPINNVAEVFASEQVAARGMRISMPYPAAATGQVDLIGNPIKFSRTPVTYRHAPPACGADTEDILQELSQEDAAE